MLPSEQLVAWDIRAAIRRAFILAQGLARSVTAVISSRVRSYTPHSVVGLSFRRAAVAEPHARKRLDLVRGRSLTPRVSPSAEWHRPITGQPVTTVRTPHAFSCDTASAISHFLRSSSGSLAIFAAIRRASSRYGPCLCRMYAGCGHTTPSSCDQKCNLIEIKFF
jgi:hypothetical protein